MKTLLRAFIDDDRGVTLVEYGIALVLAIFVGAALLTGLGAEVNTQLGDAQATMQ